MEEVPTMELGGREDRVGSCGDGLILRFLLGEVPSSSSLGL